MAVHVGIMQFRLEVPGARSLKDRRRALKSLQDRVRHRFDVTWNEADEHDDVDRRSVVCTTAGSDARLLRSTLDKIRRFVEDSGKAWPISVEVDVFPWNPHERRWSEETEPVASSLGRFGSERE